VLGGSVSGGRILNRFPESLLSGNAQDVGRGRMIPQYPWESMMTPIAQWMGGQSSSRRSASWLSPVFPNLANFNTSEDIISASTLFTGFTVSPTPSPTPGPTPSATPSPTPSVTPGPTPSPTPSPVVTKTLSAVVGGAAEVSVASTAGFTVGDTIAIEGGGNFETRIIVEIRTSRAAWASATGGILVLDSALLDHYPVDSSVTLSVTTAPTSAPAVGATGDPHLQNIHGQRFDLFKPGSHILINIPKEDREHPFLRVQADARRLGGCKDMYFQELNISGSWAETKQSGGYRFAVSHRMDTISTWIRFGKVETKVVHGRTQSGLDYLNFYVKHLGQTGFAVGGLLGDDDHSDASTLPNECRHPVALTSELLFADGHGPSELSVAVASFG